MSVRTFWTSVTSGMSGHFAVLLIRENGEVDIMQTGIGRYPTADGAEIEAREWAESEGLSYGDPNDKPIDYSAF